MQKKFSLFVMAIVSLTIFPISAFAAAAPPQEPSSSLWQLLAAGGVTMIFQGFLSVAALAIIIYHFKYVNEAKLLPSDFSENLLFLLEKKEYEKAISVSKQQKNIVSALSLGVLPRLSKGSKLTSAQIENAVQAEGKNHIEKLWQNLTYLGDIAVVAPLLGLLGTVLGIMNAFHYFKSGSIHPGVLTQGLAKAMVNTVAGLVTAVICLVFYSYFRSRVSAITTRAESVASEMTQVLSR